MSAGQHVHLTGDLKGNVSIAAQQGMHFTQHPNSNATSQSQTTNANQPTQSPMSTPQHQNSPASNNMASPNPMSQSTTQQVNQQNPQLGGGLLSSNQQMSATLGSQLLGSGIPNNGNLPNNGMAGNMSSSNNMNVPTSNNGNASGGGIGGPNGMPNSMPGSMPGMQQQHPSMQHVGGGMTDSYSLSQTQTINFTHQSLRRAGGTGKY